MEDFIKEMAEKIRQETGADVVVEKITIDKKDKKEVIDNRLAKANNETDRFKVGTGKFKIEINNDIFSCFGSGEDIIAALGLLAKCLNTKLDIPKETILYAVKTGLEFEE